MACKMRDPEQVCQALEELSPKLIDFPFWPELRDRLCLEIWSAFKGRKSPKENMLGALTFSSKRLIDSGLPEKVAEIVFDDKRLVFDVSDCIRGEHFVVDALIGVRPPFEPPERETLSAFIRRRGCGVIVFDNLQAFNVQAIEILAEICDTGEVNDHSNGEVVPADRTIVLATAAVRLPTIEELAGANLKLDDLPDEGHPSHQSVFSDLLWEALSRRYPGHLSLWVYDRFQHRLDEHLWPLYRNLLREGSLDKSIDDYTDRETKFWPEDALPPPEADHRQVVDDVRPIIASAAKRRVPISKHVFISYRTAQKQEEAEWLTDRLREKGLTVWLDRDSLDERKDTDLNRKAALIRKLVPAVRACRCMIAFAASAQPYPPLPEGYTEEDAIRRGLAMRLDQALIPWNWQTFEIEHAADALIIDTKTVYGLQNGRETVDFGNHPYKDRDELWGIVCIYLGALGILREH